MRILLIFRILLKFDVARIIVAALIVYHLLH
jgi:hypothetical protein